MLYKKMRILILILIASLIFISGCSSSIDAETAKCIASNSKIYISTGCHACAMQEEIFGDSFSYLNVVDCKINAQECIDNGITEIPTWFFGEKRISGVQTESQLKELAGC